MAIRIDNQMSMLKTQDMTADRVRDTRTQALNPAVMEHEENKLRDEELHRTQAVSETEDARVEENKRQREQESKRKGREREQPEEPQPPPPDDETERLQREAAARFLRLPVDKGKFARPEEHRIDVQW